MIRIVVAVTSVGQFKITASFAAQTLQPMPNSGWHHYQTRDSRLRREAATNCHSAGACLPKPLH